MVSSPGCPDEDEDGVSDRDDDCPKDAGGWISNTETDYDGDGCRDKGYDSDDDNDGILDTEDKCPLSPLSFKSTEETDPDSDGCEGETIEDTPTEAVANFLSDQLSDPIKGMSVIAILAVLALLFSIRGKK